MVGCATLLEHLGDLVKAALDIAKRLDDPLLTPEVVAALVDFLSEDLCSRSGYYVRALLALKQRRACAHAERIDFVYVVAVCDLFHQHVNGSTVRDRLSL